MLSQGCPSRSSCENQQGLPPPPSRMMLSFSISLMLCRWADYLRKHVAIESNEEDEVMRAVHLPKALKVAQGVTLEEADSNQLPGIAKK